MLERFKRIVIKWFLMSLDRDLLEQLIEFNRNGSSKYQLEIKDVKYDMEEIDVVNAQIPINEPTTRGGVYFSEKFAYKMSGKIKDLSVVPLLTEHMLGPNTEFGKLKITAQIVSSSSSPPSQKSTTFEISTNLINSVQTSDSIKLYMIIVNIESVS